MRRNGGVIGHNKRKGRWSDDERMIDALASVKSGTSILAASKHFSIPLRTLYAHVGRTLQKPGIKSKYRAWSGEQMAAALANVGSGTSVIEASKNFSIPMRTLYAHVEKNRRRVKLARPQRRRRTWSDEQMTAALASIRSGSSVSDASKQFGIPGSTLHVHRRSAKQVSQRFSVPNQMEPVAKRKKVKLEPSIPRIYTRVPRKKAGCKAKGLQNIKSEAPPVKKLCRSQKRKEKPLGLISIKQEVVEKVKCEEVNPVYMDDEQEIEVIYSKLAQGLDPNQKRKCVWTLRDLAKALKEIMTGKCKQSEVIKKFGISSSTLTRALRKYKGSSYSQGLRKPKGDWTEQDKDKALQLVKTGKCTQAEVIKKFGISSSTLGRALRKSKTIESRCRVLNEKEETLLDSTVRDLVANGFKLSSNDIRSMTFEYFAMNDIPLPEDFDSTSRMANFEWYQDFISRHPLIRVTEEEDQEEDFAPDDEHDDDEEEVCSARDQCGTEREQQTHEVPTVSIELAATKTSKTTAPAVSCSDIDSVSQNLLPDLSHFSIGRLSQVPDIPSNPTTTNFFQLIPTPSSILKAPEVQPIVAVPAPVIPKDNQQPVIKPGAAVPNPMISAAHDIDILKPMISAAHDTDIPNPMTSAADDIDIPKPMIFAAHDIDLPNPSHSANIPMKKAEIVQKKRKKRRKRLTLQKPKRGQRICKRRQSAHIELEMKQIAIKVVRLEECINFPDIKPKTRSQIKQEDNAGIPSNAAETNPMTEINSAQDEGALKVLNELSKLEVNVKLEVET